MSLSSPCCNCGPFSAFPSRNLSGYLDLGEAEDGPFAGVEDLGDAEQRSERREVPFQLEGARETAEFHGGALVLAPALPVEPAQGGARDADPLGPLEQRLELPIHRRTGHVQVRYLQRPAQHVERESPEPRPDP